MVSVGVSSATVVETGADVGSESSGLVIEAPSLMDTEIGSVGASVGTIVSSGMIVEMDMSGSDPGSVGMTVSVGTGGSGIDGSSPGGREMDWHHPLETANDIAKSEEMCMAGIGVAELGSL